MKGLTHFVSGVALASCLPWSMEAAGSGNPLYFLLGGIFGLLPDTLDFKFYRYFYRYDRTVSPNPRKPDPGAIAEEVADAVAAAARSPGMLRLKLDSLRTGADRWRRYTLRFDAPRQGVEVAIGPEVTTGQVPLAGTAPPEGESRVWKALEVPIRVLDDPLVAVDIFDGPALGFEKGPDGRVETTFLPWHRGWTHSPLAAGVFGVAVAVAAGWRAGVVVAGAYLLHILEDQLGRMGSNLFFPFSRRRTRGLGWMRSGDALPNLGTVWFCCLLIFWNAYRALPDPAWHFGFARLLLYGGILPLAAYGLLRWLADAPWAGRNAP